MKTQYAIVIEEAGKNFSAYVPDVPGCIATGKTREECKENLRLALKFHLDGLKLEHLAPPPSTTSVEIVTLG
jgi:predicted RNase H-like HicB family nuclease